MSDWITYEELLAEVVKNMEEKKDTYRPNSIIEIRNRPVSVYSIMTAISSAGSDDGIPTALLTDVAPDYSDLDPASPLTPETQLMKRFQNVFQTKLEAHQEESPGESEGPKKKKFKFSREEREKKKLKQVRREMEEDVETETLRDTSTATPQKGERSDGEGSGGDSDDEAAKRKGKDKKQAMKHLFKALMKRMGVD